jgi:hypothetical protein
MFSLPDGTELRIAILLLLEKLIWLITESDNLSISIIQILSVEPHEAVGALKTEVPSCIYASSNQKARKA